MMAQLNTHIFTKSTSGKNEREGKIQAILITTSIFASWMIYFRGEKKYTLREC